MRQRLIELIILVTIMLIVPQGSATVPSTCFEKTQVYGSKTSATPVSDISHLRSSSYVYTNFARKITVCGTLQDFEGVQITLQDSVTDQQQVLNPMGRTSPCSYWYIATGDYVTEMRLGYSSTGVSYLKATLSNGREYERGTLKSSDYELVEVFQEDSPLVGLHGYQNSSILKALGFIRYICGALSPPEQPQAPRTIFTNNQVNIVWNPPEDGGSAITAYTIYVLTSDSVTYATELTNCNGLSSSIISSKSCWIPASVLRAAPFNLEWGSYVFAKIMATNELGDSRDSDPGSGAFLVSSPDAPIDLKENFSFRTASTLGLQWQDGSNLGGLSIIDYRVNVKESEGEWSVMASGITTQFYTAFYLTPGVFYVFKVEARNSNGYSEASSQLQLLCAYRPDASTFVGTSNNGNKIQIYWQAPESNGNPVSGYKIAIKQSDGKYNEAIVCDAAAREIFKTRTCNVLLSTLTAAPYLLNLGEPINVRIAAQNEYGEGPWSSDGNGAVIQYAPDSPINLQKDASQTSDLQIKIQWLEGPSNGGSAVTDFAIWCDKGSGTYLLVKKVGNDLSYTTDFSITAGDIYKFQVTATNLIGTSEFSNQVTVMAARVPDEPQNIQNIQLQQTGYQIGIKWSAPVSEGGSPLLDYQVLWSKGNSKTSFTEYASAITDTSLIITGLTPGQTYNFQVKARNRIGLSQQSATLSVLAAQIPNPPTALQNVPSITRYDQIGLSWSTPSFDGGSQIIDYRIWSDRALGGYFTIQAENITKTELTLQELTQGNSYKLKVEARNTYGFSSFSNIISVLTAYVPARPDTPTTSQVDDDIVIDWQATDNGGSKITSYTIQVQTNDYTFVVLPPLYCQVTQETTCSVPMAALREIPFALKWGVGVYAKVIASNQYGDSDISFQGNGAYMITIPSEPLSLQEDTSKRTETTLGLLWSQPAFKGGASSVTYTVVRSMEGGRFTLYRSNMTETSIEISGLAAGITYQFKVKAMNSYGDSEYSAELLLLCAFVPDRPLAPSTLVAADQAVVYWVEPETNGSPITEYRTYIRQRESPFDFTLVDCMNFDSILEALTCKIQLVVLTQEPFSLQLGDSIYAKVIATNIYGDSPLSSGGNGGTMKLIPDAPKSLLKDSRTSQSTILFSWADGLSQGGTPIIDYTIYYDQGLGTNQFALLEQKVVTKFYRTIETLIPDTTYIFMVAARNSVGESLLSEKLAIVAASVPGVPEDFFNIVKATTAYKIGLSWYSPLTDGGSPVLDYQISYGSTSVQEFQTVLGSITGLTYTVTEGLTPGTTYNFIIQARNRVGLSVISKQISVLAAQVPDAPESLQNLAELTGRGQIGLSWLVPSFQGGSRVIDYRLVIDNGDGNFAVLAKNLTSLEFTANSLTTGVTYRFKVQARNILGYGLFSETVSIVSAEKPLQPTRPTTTWSPDDVIISWEAPDDNGSPITGYKVLIRKSDDTYAPELTYCNGSSTRIMEQKECTIPVVMLRASPFRLPWGNEIYARVIATNIYGDSIVSEEGSGAIILTKPDAPVSLDEEQSLRTKSDLGLKWQPASLTGGSPIIDYRISMSQAGASYFIIAQNLSEKSYTAKGLIAGITYQFYVESRNEYGYSSSSKVLPLNCAYKPEAPSVVTSTNLGDQVAIQWSSPITNGSPITGYKVYIKQHASDTYTQEVAECRGSSTVVIANRVCYVSLNVLKAEPYSLERGENVHVKVIAQNQYGDSPYSSVEGNFQGQIQSAPDAPINLQNDASITTDTVIQITWEEGVSNGGSPVLDYTLFYDQGKGSWVQLVQGVTDLFYQTGITLTADSVYSFKVRARNSIGNSYQSRELKVRAAAIPDSPTSIHNVASSTNGTQISLDWTSWTSGVYYNGGSAVLDYRVSLAVESTSQNRRRLQTLNYEVFASGIDTTYYTVTGLNPGYRYSFVVQARNLVGFSAYSIPLSITAAQTPDAPFQLTNNAKETSGNQIGITWQAPEFNGGTKVLDYRILSNNGAGSEFRVIQSGVTSLSYTATSLTQGLTYRFKVQARNSQGYSGDSPVVVILAAQTPSKPSAPTTTWGSDNVSIAWEAPNSGGSPITGYKVLIQKYDDSWIQDLVNCDASESTQTSCTIPVNVLITPPFSLNWGTNVNAKVIATSSFGDSVESSEGNGAVIITSSDYPLDLKDDASLRTKSTLGLTWSPPIFLGGSEILDFRVSMKTAAGSSFQIIASNVATSSYVATNLRSGVNYQFKVQARNTYGYSAASQTLELLCAYQPEAPDYTTTNNRQDKIQIEWLLPESNGSPITEYKLFIRQHSSTTYSQVSSTECDGTSSTVISNRRCQINPQSLKSEPFNLVKGEIVWAKIVAHNEFGDSAYSVAGSGAILMLVPDRPFNLANDVTVTSDQMIQFTWREGLSNGGSEVLDYSVYYDPTGLGSYTQLASGVTDELYNTTFTLSRFSTYQFKVAARNQVGLSSLSDALRFAASDLDGSSSSFNFVLQSETAASAGEAVGGLSSNETIAITTVSVVSGVAAAATGASILAIIIAVIITAVIAICCTSVVILVWRRKLNKQIHPTDEERRIMMKELQLQKLGSDLDKTPSANKMNDIDTTMIKTPMDITAVPSIAKFEDPFMHAKPKETDEQDQDQRKVEANLLRGKTMREKLILLGDLQKQKEREIQTHHRMERQQLRHDEIQANRRIQEQNSIEAVFTAIYSNEKTTDVKANEGPAQTYKSNALLTSMASFRESSSFLPAIKEEEFRPSALPLLQLSHLPSEKLKSFQLVNDEDLAGLGLEGLEIIDHEDDSVKPDFVHKRTMSNGADLATAEPLFVKRVMGSDNYQDVQESSRVEFMNISAQNFSSIHKLKSKTQDLKQSLQSVPSNGVTISIGSDEYSHFFDEKEAASWGQDEIDPELEERVPKSSP